MNKLYKIRGWQVLTAVMLLIGLPVGSFIALKPGMEVYAPALAVMMLEMLMALLIVNAALQKVRTKVMAARHS